MPSYQEILSDSMLNGVYRVPSVPADLPGLVRLDARGHADKGELLEALGRVLRFPPYYGVNWDALEECLFDMSWHEGPIVLAIEHADALRGEDLATLADIWVEAAAAWGEAGRGCVLLLHGVGLEELPLAE